MMRTTLELTKDQGDWVLCTSNVVIRFTPEAVVFTNENGSIKLEATPNGAVTVPVAEITQACAVHADGSGWWSNLKARRSCLVILHGQHRDGSRSYHMYARATNTDGVEEPAFQLRLTLNREGSVDGFFVSDAVRVNDFLRSFLAAVLMKVGKTYPDAIADTAHKALQAISNPIA
jgi:hypothetical protein